MADPKTPKKEDDDDNRLEWLVGLFVVVLATFLGICNVKDGNIVQRMQLHQADRIDNFSWYQARKVRISVYESFAEQMSVPIPNETPEGAKLREAKVAEFKNKAARQLADSKEQQEKGEQADKDYKRANFMDDQFDISEAALAIGLALMGVTAMSKRWWMFFVALVPSLFGLGMGIAGFAGMDTNHPVMEWIMGILA